MEDVVKEGPSVQNIAKTDEAEPKTSTVESVRNDETDSDMKSDDLTEVTEKLAEPTGIKEPGALPAELFVPVPLTPQNPNDGGTDTPPATNTESASDEKSTVPGGVSAQPPPPATEPTEPPKISKFPLFPSGFGQIISPTFLKGKVNPVTPGTKDSEGFLAPPPASSLFSRRARVGSTGTPTSVPSTSEASPAPESENVNLEPPPPASPEKETPPAHDINGTPVRRKPGRPVGSTCKFKKPPTSIPPLDSPTTSGSEVRVSSRSSSSIFKHDGASTPAINTFGASSQWIFPLPFRPHISGGKPPMTGSHQPYSKANNVQKKDRNGSGNIDPLTGKRRYTRKNRIGVEKKSRGVPYEPEHNRPRQHLSDNGVWRPTDDLRLIVNTLAVEDLEKVFIGVKFSCNFTYKEVEDRWRKLMYGENSALVAQNAIIALHPQVKALIYSEALFSPEEEKLISTVKNVPFSNPDISCFQTLLDENLQVFNKHRTAKSLMTHWLDMRDFHLLPDQDVMDYSLSQNFDDFEEIVVDEDIHHEPNDEAIAQEIKIEDRNLKNKIRIVEDEITAWQLLIDQIMEDGRKDRTLPTLSAEFDGKTFAILRGLQVQYVMTSEEITLGRSTKFVKVDADLTQEGSSNKISRKQAVIKLKDMGKFIIINKGKHPIFVDRKAVHYKCATTLHDQSVIQIAHISLVFVINGPLIEKLIEQDVLREVHASFKDLDLELPPMPMPPKPHQIGSPALLYSSPTPPPPLRTNLLPSFTDSALTLSPNWGYNYSPSINETNSQSYNPASGSGSRMHFTESLPRYNPSSVSSSVSQSVMSGYPAMNYNMPIPSSSKALMTSQFISNIRHTSDAQSKPPEVMDGTTFTSSLDGTPYRSGLLNWETPVSSLTQCSIGQMSGSVSTVPVPITNYANESSSQTNFQRQMK